MRKINKIIGHKFGRLTILELVNPETAKTICECGTIKEINLYAVLRGNTKSCGCYNLECLTDHGLSNHPLYKVWTKMISRCYYKKNKYYKNYGGRGVSVSNRWRHDFKSFYDWAIDKWKPGLQLDKDIRSGDKNGDFYCPELCCFVTSKQNNRQKINNNYLTFKGETKCLMEWSEITKITYATLNARINRLGWSVEDALTIRPKTNYIR